MTKKQLIIGIITLIVLSCSILIPSIKIEYKSITEKTNTGLLKFLPDDDPYKINALKERLKNREIWRKEYSFDKVKAATHFIVIIVISGIFIVIVKSIPLICNIGKDLSKKTLTMSGYRQIILIIGAVLFIIVLLTSPKVVRLQGGVLLKPSEASTRLAPVMDIKTASVRGIAVLGATVLLFFAFKDKK